MRTLAVLYALWLGHAAIVRRYTRSFEQIPITSLPFGVRVSVFLSVIIVGATANFPNFLRARSVMAWTGHMFFLGMHSLGH